MKRKKYVHNYMIKNTEEVSLDNKEIKQIVENHIIKYKKSKLQIQYFDALPLISQSIDVEKEKLQSYVNYIEKILENLTPISKEIIYEEYLNNKKNESWWNKKYSRSTFFKTRQMAIREFYVYVS